MTHYAVRRFYTNYAVEVVHNIPNGKECIITLTLPCADQEQAELIMKQIAETPADREITVQDKNGTAIFRRKDLISAHVTTFHTAAPSSKTPRQKDRP